jgi:predicted restriction endonuclease
MSKFKVFCGKILKLIIKNLYKGSVSRFKYLLGSNRLPRQKNGQHFCSMHHKLFDRGVFTIDHDTRRFLVSDQANGNSGFNEWLMKYPLCQNSCRTLKLKYS